MKFRFLVVLLFLFGVGAAQAQTKYTSTNQYQCSKNLLTNTFACTAGYMTMYSAAGDAVSVHFSTPHLFILEHTCPTNPVLPGCTPYQLYLNGTEIISYTLTGPSGTHPGTFSYNWTGCTSGGQCYSGTGLVMWVNGVKSFQALTTYEELVIDSGSQSKNFYPCGSDQHDCLSDGTCPDKQCCPPSLPQCKPITVAAIVTPPSDRIECCYASTGCVCTTGPNPFCSIGHYQCDPVVPQRDLLIEKL